MVIKRKKKEPLRKPKKEIPFPEKLDEILKDFFDYHKELKLEERIAVFDLDNTLLDGDIGDASLAHLIDNEIDIGLSWTSYTQMIADGKNLDAYASASKGFAGMEEGCVRRFANVVLTMKDENIKFYEDESAVIVPVPKPNPVMKEVVNRLQENKFRIYIISASNQYLVEEAAAMFGISKKNCFGVRQIVKKIDEVFLLQKDIESPFPYADGKKHIFQNEISQYKPILTSGDSISDIDFMELTKPGGLVLWRGSDQDLNDVKDNIDNEVRKIHYNSLFANL